MAKSKIVKKSPSVRKGLKDKLKAEQILNTHKLGEPELEQKKSELIEAKEKYYRLCSEFIALWSKTRRAQRGA
jgi:hypothetical protein